MCLISVATVATAVAQEFYSHIVPKAVLLFTREAPDDDMYFELENGEVKDKDNKNKGRKNKGGGGTVLPISTTAKTTGEW